jgi:hypothetical protein
MAARPVLPCLATIETPFNPQHHLSRALTPRDARLRGNQAIEITFWRACVLPSIFFKKNPDILTITELYLIFNHPDKRRITKKPQLTPTLWRVLSLPSPDPLA